MNFNFRLFLITIFILTVGYKTFGYSFYWLGIPLGPVVITEGLVAFVILSWFAINRVKFVNWGNRLLMPFLLLIIFTIIQAFRNIFFDQMSINSVLDRLPLFLTLFFVFPLVYQFTTINQIEKFVKIVIAMGITASFIMLLQFLFPYELMTRIRVYEGFIRVRTTANILVVFNLLLSFSYLLLSKSRGGKKKKYSFLFVLSASTLMLTLSRGLILGSIISMIIIILIYNVDIKKSIISFRSIVIAILSLIVVLTVSFFTEISFETYISKINEGITEFTAYESQGSIGIRKEMIAVKFITNFNENPILGRGLNFEEYEGLKEGSKEYYTLFYFNPYALTGDTTWPNIMLVYGIIGIIIFLIILFNLFKEARSIISNKNSIFVNSILFSTMSIPGFIAIHSFAASYLSSHNLILIVILSVSLFHLKKKLDVKDNL